MRRIITAIIATAALGGAWVPGAVAADLPVAPTYAPVYTKAPPPPSPVMSWTGFYIGGDVGGTWFKDQAAWNPLPIGPAPAFGANPITATEQGSSVIGGAHIGYNYQVAPAGVVGIEGDWMWSGAKASFTQPWTFFGTATVVPGSSTTMGTQLEWLASIRGRVGYLVAPTVLLYGTGGVAFADFKYTASNTNGVGGAGNYNAPVSLTNTQPGWVAGGGLEWMVTNNWSVRGEYLFYQFNRGLNVIATSVNFPAFPSNYVWGRTNINVVRAGVSYKF